MALGGGTFISQNKILPGTYTNLVSAQKASSLMGERGVVAIGMSLNWGESSIIEVTAEQFIKDSLKIFGYDYSSNEMKNLREIFKNATKAYIYNLNQGGVKASNDYATAKYAGTRGNDIKIVIAKNVDDDTKFDVTTLLGDVKVDTQTVTTAANLTDNEYVIFNKDTSVTLAVTAGTPLASGTNGTSTGQSHQDFLNALESYNFNALCCTSTETETIALYVAYTKRLRDKQGMKFQTVVYNNRADYEGVVNVKNSASEETIGLVYWVAGIIAGCAINKSNTNKVYDGEYTVVANYTQSQLEDCIKDGEFVLHKVGDEVRVLVDINSLVSVTTEKGEDFKSNQTIRVLDQFATDTASIFNTKYLGKIPNDEAGRTSLWNDIVKLAMDYQTTRAIENFEDGDISIQKGNDKKSVSIDTALEPVNAMEKLYMTVVVE